MAKSFEQLYTERYITFSSEAINQYHWFLPLSSFLPRPDVLIFQLSFLNVSPNFNVGLRCLNQEITLIRYQVLYIHSDPSEQRNVAKLLVREVCITH